MQSIQLMTNRLMEISFEIDFFGEISSVHGKCNSMDKKIVCTCQRQGK